MGRITEEAKYAIDALLFDTTIPASLKTAIYAALSSPTPKETALRNAVAIATDPAQPLAARTTACRTIVDSFKESLT